jgi:hypothetical protein
MGARLESVLQASALALLGLAGKNTLNACSANKARLQQAAPRSACRIMNIIIANPLQRAAISFLVLPFVSWYHGVRTC